MIDGVISSIEIRFDLRENLDPERIPFPNKGESLLPYTLAKRFSAMSRLQTFDLDEYYEPQPIEADTLLAMLWDLRENCQSARQYPGGEAVQSGRDAECLLFGSDLPKGKQVWAARQPSGSLFSFSRPKPFVTGITYFVPSLEIEIESRRRTVIDQFRTDQRAAEEQRRVDEQRRSDPGSF